MYVKTGFVEEALLNISFQLANMNVLQRCLQLKVVDNNVAFEEVLCNLRKTLLSKHAVYKRLHIELF